MAHEFDREYWESHWRDAKGAAPGGEMAPHPYVARELGGLTPGTALDAGCGEGAEALWLATHGWQVTAADISSAALGRAEERGRKSGVPPERVHWIQADLGAWEPGRQFDLVTTFYAHPAMPQLAFYERISRWVAPGGTLLIVGHLHHSAAGGHSHAHAHHGHAHDHGHHGDQPPDEATATGASIRARFHNAPWDVVTAEELTRTAGHRGGQPVQLNDVVVQLRRRANVP